MALRVFVGKGNPKDIYDELESILVQKHLAKESLSDEALKKILTDSNLGIDCSGYAYYILDAESEETKSASLSRKLTFVNSKGLSGVIASKLRPAENCSVAVLAHEKNSKVVSLKEIAPGDIITMITKENEGERNHILIVTQVEAHDSLPVRIHYTHSVAYPEDGVYGTGIKQGIIEVADVEKNLLSQRWIENNLENDSNRIYLRAHKSETELRRLNWL